jgi:hypothetical protein
MAIAWQRGLDDVPGGSGSKANHTHIKLNLGITLGRLAHCWDHFADRIVQRLDLAADGHRSGTVKQPDNVQRSACVFSTGSHRHVVISPLPAFSPL